MNIRVKSRPHCLVFPSQACVKQSLPYIFKEIKKIIFEQWKHLAQTHKTPQSIKYYNRSLH